MRARRRQLSRQVSVVAVAALSVVWVSTGAAQERIVTVRTVTEDALTGELIRLSTSDGVLLRTVSGERRIPLADVVRVATATMVSTPDRRDLTLTLINGDRLHGRLVETVDETVAVDGIDFGRIRIALESIAGIDTERATQPAFRASVDWLDRSRNEAEDHILLSNGDVVSGLIVTMDADGIAVEGTLGETIVPHRRIVAVRFAPMRAPVLHSPHGVITLRTSGRLTAGDLSWAGKVIEARLQGGQSIVLEAERIVRLDVIGGRWQWLSQHQPISFEHTPMLSLDWAYANDHNVLGGPISVAGKTFEHGIGVHSRSSLTYDLKGLYDAFVTSFGVDDDSGPFADVDVAVFVDGQRRFEKAHVRRGVLHGPVRLDVKRAKRVSLLVDFGENGDVQDRFNWVETALVLRRP